MIEEVAGGGIEIRTEPGEGGDFVVQSKVERIRELLHDLTVEAGSRRQRRRKKRVLVSEQRNRHGTQTDRH